MTQDSMSALRAEVEAAFEEASLQLDALLDGIPDDASVLEIDVAPTQEIAPAPQPVMAPPPPPPPPPPPAPALTTNVVAPSHVWQEAMDGNDPLVAFAPPPRMDWGPERQGFLRRSRH